MMYSNPRLDVTIADWPTGSHRTTAHFWIETHTSRGQRGMRQTAHPITGKLAAPKKLTYARQARIVDGDDGRTYILELGVYSKSLSVMQGNMQFQAEHIAESDPRHAALLALFNA